MKFYSAIFIGLVLLFCGAVMMHLFADVPGYVYVRIASHELYFNIWVGFILLLLAALLVYFFVRVLKIVLQRFSGGFLWLRDSRKKVAERKTKTGLLRYIEGNWQGAKKDLVSAAKNSNTPLLNYLASARCAIELGLDDEAQFLLQQAETIDDDRPLTLNLMQVRMHLDKGDLPQALALLEVLSPDDKQNPAALELLRQTYVRMANWEKLVALLPALKSSKHTSKDQWLQLQEATYLSLLQAKAQDPATTKEDFENCWQATPKVIKSQALAITEYVKILQRYDSDDEAEQLLKKTLKSQWSAGLVEMYGALNGRDANAQIKTAESWLPTHGDDPSLQFALGKLAVKNSHWAQARDCFERSLSLRERPQIYAELASVMEKLGEHKKSTALYQKGLQLALK